MGFIQGFKDGYQGKPTLSGHMLCRNCGDRGKPKRVTKGSLLIEIFLYFFLIIPGVIYTLWRLTSRYDGCRKCGSPMLAPLDSPVAQESMTTLESKKKCPECAEMVQAEAKVCRFCRHSFAA